MPLTSSTLSSSGNTLLNLGVFNKIKLQYICTNNIMNNILSNTNIMNFPLLNTINFLYILSKVMHYCLHNSDNRQRDGQDFQKCSYKVEVKIFKQLFQLMYSFHTSRLSQDPLIWFALPGMRKESSMALCGLYVAAGGRLPAVTAGDCRSHSQ